MCHGCSGAFICKLSNALSILYRNTNSDVSIRDFYQF